jgi:hypothetical protein
MTPPGCTPGGNLPEGNMGRQSRKRLEKRRGIIQARFLKWCAKNPKASASDRRFAHLTFEMNVMNRRVTRQYRKAGRRAA